MFLEERNLPPGDGGQTSEGSRDEKKFKVCFIRSRGASRPARMKKEIKKEKGLEGVLTKKIKKSEAAINLPQMNCCSFQDAKESFSHHPNRKDPSG